MYRHRRQHLVQDREPSGRSVARPAGGRRGGDARAGSGTRSAAAPSSASTPARGCARRPRAGAGLTPWRRSVQPRIQRVRTSCPLRAPYPRLRGPSIPRSGLERLFGGSGVALRDAELLERFSHACTPRTAKAFTSRIQDFAQLLRDFILRDHQTKLRRRASSTTPARSKGCDLRTDVVRRDHGRFQVYRIVVDR